MRIVTVGTESDELRRSLDHAHATLKASGHDARVEIVRGQSEKALAEIVARDGIDLLTMGAYRHSRIRSMIIGSTTTEMIRSSRIPVLLFR